MYAKILILTASVSMAAIADTVVPQAGENPIIFDQQANIDNLVFLMAGGSEHNSGMTAGDYGSVKHMWITNFNDNTTDYLQWNVRLAVGARYHVWALLNSGSAVPMRLSVEGQGTSLDFATRNIGWDKLDAGAIDIPAGTQILKLVRNSAGAGIDIKSLELIRESDKPAYEARVADFKRHPAWFSGAKYGLMLQFGPWGYPKSGARKSLQDFANGFDVDKLIAKVEATGARYVIWSATWYEYKIIAPVKSVDSISGSSAYTASRDVIGEIATALRAKGIRFFLYYHSGFPGLYGQGWPANFHLTGTGDRSKLFNTFTAVIGEMGARYGTRLDGWFFDDACNYYPAPFERLAHVARMGNPDRLVSWNAWVAARFTDFQDVLMGEGGHGEAQFGSSPAGGNGVFTDGPQKGLMGHAMFVMGDDWGIHNANQPINTRVNPNQSLAWVRSASARGVPLSFDLEMWEDQTTAPASENILAGLKSSFGAISIHKYPDNAAPATQALGTRTLINAKGARMVKDHGSGVGFILQGKPPALQGSGGGRE